MERLKGFASDGATLYTVALGIHADTQSGAFAVVISILLISSAQCITQWYRESSQFFYNKFMYNSKGYNSSMC